MTDETIELKPCPFCGGFANRRKNPYHEWIECIDCGANISDGGHGIDIAVEKWNRRTRHRVALEVDTPAEAAALRALLARHGSRRRIARALVTGELVITEGDEQ